jgi:hypothetical protein
VVTKISDINTLCIKDNICLPAFVALLILTTLTLYTFYTKAVCLSSRDKCVCEILEVAWMSLIIKLLVLSGP